MHESNYSNVTMKSCNLSGHVDSCSHMDDVSVMKRERVMCFMLALIKQMKERGGKGRSCWIDQTKLMLNTGFQGQVPSDLSPTMSLSTSLSSRREALTLVKASAFGIFVNSLRCQHEIESRCFEVGVKTQVLTWQWISYKSTSCGQSSSLQALFRSLVWVFSARKLKSKQGLSSSHKR